MDFTNILQSISVIIAAIAVIIGVNEWRREYIGKGNFDLAEEVLALFYEARDVIRYIRNPFSFSGEGSTRNSDPNESPEEKKINDRAHIVFERYSKRQDLFNKLYSMRYRYMVRFGKDSAKPFDDLNNIVSGIFSSASMLAYYWKDQGRRTRQIIWQGTWQNDEEFQKHLKEMRKHEAIFWEMAPDEDLIKPKLDAAIADIEAQCIKIMGKQSMFQQFRRWFKAKIKLASKK